MTDKCPDWQQSALPSSTGLPSAIGTSFVDRSPDVIVQCMYISKSPVGEESISMNFCFPSDGGRCFMSGMSVQTCLDRNAMLPRIVEYDVARNAGIVHEIDFGGKCRTDACVLCRIFLSELEVSGSLCLKDEG